MAEQEQESWRHAVDADTEEREALDEQDAKEEEDAYAYDEPRLFVYACRPSELRDGNACNLTEIHVKFERGAYECNEPVEAFKSALHAFARKQLNAKLGRIRRAKKQKAQQ